MCMCAYMYILLLYTLYVIICNLYIINLYILYIGTSRQRNLTPVYNMKYYISRQEQGR